MFSKKVVCSGSDTNSEDGIIIECIPTPFYKLGFSQYIDIVTQNSETIFSQSTNFSDAFNM